MRKDNLRIFPGWKIKYVVLLKVSQASSLPSFLLFKHFTKGFHLSFYDDKNWSNADIKNDKTNSTSFIYKKTFERNLFTNKTNRYLVFTSKITLAS